jgi:hypothetical protein
MKRRWITAWAGVAWLFVLAAFPASSRAQNVFFVTFDTSPLVGNASGPFSLDFQLLDGSLLGDANNTAMVGSFAFLPAGGPSGPPTTLGDATGDIAAGIALRDTFPINELSQPVDLGDRLAFALTMTANEDTGGIPDLFSFAILDNTGSAIPTDGPANALLVADLQAGTVQTFSGIGDFAGVSALSVVAVPEPGSVGLLASSAGGLLLLRRRSRR